MEGIAARIAPIFEWTPEKTRDFMNVLNETKTDVTATSFFEDLPRIDESDIPTIKLGSGAYGEVTTDEEGRFAYKQIEIDSTHGSLSPRNLLMEAFIQAVLCTDPDPQISSNICKLHNVYGYSVHTSINPEDPAYEEDEYYIVLKMDNIGRDSTIYDMVNNKSADNILSRMKGIITKLITLLDLLQIKYMFQHSDLHIKNLAVKDDHIQLIDFGRAQITIEGKKYATTVGKTEAYNRRHNLRTILGESCDSYLSVQQHTKRLSPTLQSFAQGIISQIAKTNPALLSYIDSWVAPPLTSPAVPEEHLARRGRYSTRKRSTRKRSTRKRSLRRRRSYI
jgi:hypothetical protein